MVGVDEVNEVDGVNRVDRVKKVDKVKKANYGISKFRGIGSLEKSQGVKE